MLLNEVNMQTVVRVCVLVCVACVAVGDDTASQDEEDMNYYLGQLYRDDSDHLDPHNMLPPSKPREEKPTGWFGSALNLVGGEEDDNKEKLENESSDDNNEQLRLIQTQLLDCKASVSQLEKSVESEQYKSSLLQEKLVTDGAIDMSAFYTRLVHHLWNVLDLEEALSILKDDSSALLKHLTVRVTRKDLDTLQGFLQDQQNVHQVDEFVEQSFILDPLPDDDNTSLSSLLFSLVKSALEVGKNIEVWLYLLCVGFLGLSLWAVVLFIRDIQRELRWGRVLTMMVILCFFICCLWHWRHMHKVAESKRHAQMVRRGYTDLPDECKPEAKGTAGSIFEWIKIKILRSPDMCERYFEELMIDPSEEITPTMVIAETLAKFFLQPLQHVGSEVAKLITNFYDTVPLIYHFPATIIFVVLLVIVLFYVFGYGIDFPLWMGGIRPVYRTESANTGEVDRITQEAVAQLRIDRERFLEESRHILTDITRAATQVQGQGNINPLMMMSSNILETQLEQLISRQMAMALHQNSTAMETRPATPVDPQLALLGPVRHHGGESGNSEIRTVTSTPLRTTTEISKSVREGMRTHERYVGQGNEERARLESGRNSRDVVDSLARRGLREGVAKEGVVEVDTPSRKSRQEEEEDSEYRKHNCGLKVLTDGVHHRIEGLPKNKFLPPKRMTRDSGSTSSLEDIKKERSGVKEEKKRLKKSKMIGHSEGHLEEGEGWRNRLGRLSRKFHSTSSMNREASPSSSSTSTRSLSQDLQLSYPSESDVFEEQGATGTTKHANTSGSNTVAKSSINSPGSDTIARFSHISSPGCDVLARSKHTSTPRSDTRIKSRLTDSSSDDTTDNPNNTATSEDFYIQVRNLLEDSVNSSQNESVLDTSESSSGAVRRRRKVEEEEETGEVELSASGVKFLRSMEQVMDPAHSPEL